MKNQLFFYKEVGGNFIVLHCTNDNGKMVRYYCGQNEHGLDIIIREDHDVSSIREELEQAVKTLDLSKWAKFDSEEDEMELTHFETCMGPVEKAYEFIIEW